jgi:hypothetical protein
MKETHKMVSALRRAIKTVTLIAYPLFYYVPITRMLIKPLRTTLLQQSKIILRFISELFIVTAFRSLSIL